METFVVRAAEAAFYRAGYPREEALRQAQSLAASMLANLSGYQAEYGISDQLELAFQMARRVATRRT
jgi:hypothetical protein